MDKHMRVMTQNPLNAETPIQRLRTWITDNDFFLNAIRASFRKARSTWTPGLFPSTGT